MTTLKQELENTLIFENPYTKPITKAVIAWLQQKLNSDSGITMNSTEEEVKEARIKAEILKELLEELEQ